MSDWAQRKRVELLAKLDSVEEELAYWRGQATATGVMAKHRSQIERVSNQLLPLVARVRGAIDDADLAGTWRGLERQVLDLHRVWDFFREKLAMRYLEPFRDYLLAADEFAWACYRPVQRAAVRSGAVTADAVREPPLVCFTPAASPFSIPRGSSYAEDVGARSLVTEASRRLVQALPVPVVGVPWYQLRHLPDAVVLGHEVGHHVERDGGLTGAVRRRVEQAAAAAGASPEGLVEWRRWAAEAFADVYGVLCAGPAFARALADFLVGAAVKDTGGGDYPPVRIRVALTAAVVEAVAPTTADDQGRAGSEASGIAELRAGWAGDGIDADAGERDPEVAAVARALVDDPFEELDRMPLREVVCFDAKRLRDHRADANALLQRRSPATRDPRTLLAAAARAYAQDPVAYATTGVPGRVLQRMREIQEPGTRDAGILRATDRAAVDAAAAQALYALLVDPSETP